MSYVFPADLVEGIKYLGRLNRIIYFVYDLKGVWPSRNTLYNIASAMVFMCESALSDFIWNKVELIICKDRRQN